MPTPETLKKIYKEYMDQEQEEIREQVNKDFTTPKTANIEILKSIEKEVRPVKLKSPKYHCPKCGDFGFILQKEGEGYPVAIPCECYPYICLMQRIGESQIPERYQVWELKHFKNRLDRNNMSKITIWLDEFLTNKNKNSLYITGKVGTGKTSLAIAILKEILSRRIDGLFIRISEMLNFEKLRFADNNIKSNLENIKRVSVLVLDDLGSERLTEWTLDILWQIICYRYDSCLATIVTSNLSLTQLEQRLSIRQEDITMENVTGQRMVRRLKEISRVVNI